MVSCIDGGSIPFISQWKFLLSFRGFYMGKDPMVREKWNSYPVYLKHSLFYHDDKFEKARTLEVGHRFFIFDKFKEEGNKSMTKGDYRAAVSYYEQAFSLVKWLELKEDPKPQEKQPKKEGEEADSGEGEVATELHENMFKDLIENDPESDSEEDEKDDIMGKKNQKKKGGKPEEPKKKKVPLTEEEKRNRRKMRRLLLTTFHDGNIVLHNGEEVAEEQEKEMRESMLFGILVNLSVAYMRLSHFTLAVETLKEAESIYDKNSQMYYRMAQALTFNLSASYDDLEKAKACVEKAIGLKNYEKIFQNEQPILRLLNLHNAHEAYPEMGRIAEARLQEKKKADTEAYTTVLERVKEIGEIAAEMIAEGKTPKESDGPDLYVFGCEDEEMEHNIFKRMMAKYYRVIDFYTESSEMDKVQNAQKELLEFKATYDRFEKFWCMEFEEKEGKSNPVFKEMKEKFPE